jgi:flagellar biosynthesis protein FlhF
MKIKRFIAPDMRRALAAVKKEIGEDAVILSNKQVENGVELVAAVDFDEDQYSRIQAHQENLETTRAAGMKKQQTEIDSCDEGEADHQAAGLHALRRKAERQSHDDDPVEAMRREMRALRRMVENELSGMSWKSMGERDPDSKEMFRQLMSMGLSPAIAERLMNAVRGHGDFDQQWQKAMYYLSTEFEVTGDDLTENGGIVAVVGPTGVGKTTSIAKLAARYCLRHGNRHVALVSTDNYRIGAREQLHTYGRILNVPVRTAANAEELMQTLNNFSDKKFILIDTAGMSHQDARLNEQLAMLENAGRSVKRFLALSATTELSALKRAMHTFSDIRPDACLITKTDEAASLGGVLSAVIESGLPVAYYTDGQRVPEDMHVARANPLVTIASSLAQEMSEQHDDGYLAFALSEARAHAVM